MISKSHTKDIRSDTFDIVRVWYRQQHVNKKQIGDSFVGGDKQKLKMSRTLVKIEAIEFEGQGQSPNWMPWTGWISDRQDVGGTILILRG